MKLLLLKTGRLAMQCLLPEYCTFCGRPIGPAEPLCKDCEAELPLLLRKKEAGKAPGLDGLIAPFRYREPLRQAIRRLKWQQDRHTGRRLADWLAEWVTAVGLPLDGAVVVPVPLSLQSQLVRGYNQSEVLARRLAQRLGLPYAGGLLLKRRQTKKQHTLSAAERRENLKNCFTLAKHADLSGRTVLLVDDVFTTGSTMAACSRILRQGGAGRVYGAAVSVAGRQALESEKQRSNSYGASGRRNRSGYNEGDSFQH